jgi:hypothetical protein
MTRAGIWLAAVPWVAGIALGGWPGRYASLARAAAAAPLAFAASAVAATVAAILVAAGIARIVGLVWLGRWPLSGPLVRLREGRWQAADDAVQLARRDGDEDAEATGIVRRSAVARTAPQSPSWMGDRWNSLAERIFGAYGLDLASAWPRIWVILPPDVRAEVRTAEADWSRATAAGAWSLLYLLGGIAWWPLAVAGAFGMVWAWSGGRAAVAAHTDLVEAVVDVYAAEIASRLGAPVEPGQRLSVPAGRALAARLQKDA